jgi:GH15 family glucan-1,4-alpha-glucosidase
VAGNHAAKQFQLDAFGEALSLFAEAARQGQLDAEGWKAAEVAVEAIGRWWQEPDGGIWELENRNWTHSRLACVGGIRAICGAGAPASRIGPWTALAGAVLAETARTAVHPTGRWQRAPDDERTDAALLLPPLYGAVATDDPRTLLTLQSVTGSLVSDGYVYRYQPDARPLGESEGHLPRGGGKAGGGGGKAGAGRHQAIDASAANRRAPRR